MKYLPLDELITSLRSQGFEIGVGTYLKLQYILDNLSINPKGNPKEFGTPNLLELKYILCPLFARNHDEQQTFYNIFDKIFPAELPEQLPTQTSDTAQPTKPSSNIEKDLQPKPPIRRLWWWVAAAVLVVGVLVKAHFYYSNQKTVTQQIEAETQETQKRSDEQLADTEIKKDSLQQTERKLEQQTDSIDNQLEENKIAEITENKPTISETQKKQLQEQKRQLQEEKRISREQQMRIDSAARAAVIEKHRAELQNAYTIAEARNYTIRLWILSLVALVVLLVFAREVYKYLNRRLIANRKHDKRPARAWGIYVDKQTIDLDKEVYGIANNMRYREQGSLRYLDITQTVRNFAQTGGIFHPEYTFNSKPVEFLMLIDWSSPKNHKAQLFEYLYRTFRDNNVYVERFFYAGTPRVVWNFDEPKGVWLADLQRQYPEHYLLIFGDGGEFINPYNRDIQPWAEFFREWEQRALLTPEPTADWGYTEATLSRLFRVILPSSSKGLVELVEHFGVKSGTASDLREWKYNAQQTETEVIIYTDEYDAQGNLTTKAPTTLTVAQQLQQHYSPEICAWVTACAVYPELNWDLTLLIGEVLTQYYRSRQPEEWKHRTLCTQQNLAQLNRMHWFYNGKIPDEARRQLLENNTLLPDKARNQVVSTIIAILENNLKEQDKDTLDYDNFLMNIVVNKLLLKTTPKAERDKLLAKLEELTATSRKQDYVALEYLERTQQQQLGFALPPRFRKYFFRNGKTLFGLKTGVKAALTAAFIIIGIFVASFFRTPKYQHLQVMVHGAGGQNHIVLQNRGIVMLDLINKKIEAPIKEYGIAFFDSLLLNKSDVSETSDFYLHDSVFKKSDVFKTSDFYYMTVAIPNANTLNGKVTTSESLPIAGATVTTDTLTTQTAADGTFTLQIPPLLQAENLTIQYSHPDYYDDEKTVHHQQYQRIALQMFNDNSGDSILFWQYLQQGDAMTATLISGTGEAYENKLGQSLAATVLAYKRAKQTNYNDSLATTRQTRLQNVRDSLAQIYAAKAQDAYNIQNYTQAKKNIDIAQTLSPLYANENLSNQIEKKLKEQQTNQVVEQPDTSKTFESGDSHLKELLQKIENNMVKIQGGTFTMGSNDGEDDEKPPHEVTVSTFYMGKFEVTNEEFAAFLNQKGNQEQGGTTWLKIESSYCKIEKKDGIFAPKEGYAKHPVVQISWYGAVQYCNWLSEKTEKTKYYKINGTDVTINTGAKGYRLPTEAEWEYACRAKTQTPFYFGDCLSTDDANYDGNYPYKDCEKGKYRQGTIAVGSLNKPNAFGLHDMHGNVWEWCYDWYDEDFYSNSSNSSNPINVKVSSYKVLRGGSWINNASYCRSAGRNGFNPVDRILNYGFRVCL